MDLPTGDDCRDGAELRGRRRDILAGRFGAEAAGAGGSDQVLYRLEHLRSDSILPSSVVCRFPSGSP